MHDRAATLDALANAEPLSSRRPAAPARERGVLMVWAAFVMLLIGALILAGVERQQAMNNLTRVEHAVNGQARAVAVAGIVDAFAWFRRQTVQPVTAFAPRLDLTANPPVNETDDPTLGLVREYEISPSLWGRYEVRLSRVAEPYTDSDGNGHYDNGEPFVDQDGNGEWNGPRETRDVSIERGMPSSGGVWLLESHGFLFRRQDIAKPLGVSPNDRLAVFRVASEIRRLTLNPPAASAVCANAGSAVTIANRGRVTGGSGAAVAFPSGSGSPVLASGSEVTGSPTASGQPNYDGSIDGVFGVSLAELKGMADVSTPNVATIGAPIGDMSLNVIDGNATFDATQPLRGTGIVVVLGNCTIASGSNSFFSGMLWVGGDLTIRAPSYLRGVFIAQGTVDIRGASGDYAELNYDDSIIGELLSLMGQYRHTKAVYVPSNKP